ncbi:MAG TPA: heparan-alpha-glucosaminide N-acetyltransferase domain-containing protein, partial [Flavitalea sp.]|nr:heparan-alpha-glucosaminide N-acetyltransferase domain-containing protein [Flavitalea sp.]
MISTLQELPVKEPRAIAKPAMRIHSIDILRGAVMLIMALDHARHIFHTPAMIDEPTNLATTSPALFFTRWITHFCAPVFLFLSGISAYISGQARSKGELSVFLIKRGLWLLVVELVIMTFAITFNPSYDFFFLQVIWAIGWSMIILGLLVRTSLPVIIASAVVIF